MLEKSRKRKMYLCSVKELKLYPPEIQVDQPCLLENLCVPQNSAFYQLLVSPVSVALKDHSYCASEGGSLPQPQIAVKCMSLTEITISEEFILLVTTKDSLNVTDKEKEEIEAAIGDQSLISKCCISRSRRINALTHGKILNQSESTLALSSSVLYQKPFIIPPLPIKLGLDHEIQANRAYLQHAMRHGKHQLATRKCGFITHPTMGFLA